MAGFKTGYKSICMVSRFETCHDVNWVIIDIQPDIETRSFFSDELKCAILVYKLCVTNKTDLLDYIV